MAQLAQQIKALRTARGLTQKQLAEAVGVAQTTISALERGEFDIKVPVLCRMARVLGVDAADLTRLVCIELTTQDAA